MELSPVLEHFVKLRVPIPERLHFFIIGSELCFIFFELFFHILEVLLVTLMMLLKLLQLLLVSLVDAVGAFKLA